MAATVAILIVPVSLQVISRYTALIPAWIWTEELSRFLFIWMIMLGAMIAVREETHFVVDVLPRLPARADAMLTVISNLFVLAFALVFIAGLSMAPVFPTTLAITGQAFPQMTGTALGFVITCGWVGLAVSSRIIGSIAGNDPRRLKKALLIFPASAVLMVVLNVAIWSIIR